MDIMKKGNDVLRCAMILYDQWIVRLKDEQKTQVKEKNMLTDESKKFLLKQQNERLIEVKKRIEQIQAGLAHFGKAMHEKIVERQEIETVISQLEKFDSDSPIEEPLESEFGSSGIIRRS